MVNEYNPKSCSALEKPFYKPIEVAIRWCGLIQHETMILSAVGEDVMPRLGQFTQWPCLRANTEKIIDAILHGDLIYGRDGSPVPKGEQVAKHRLTIRHADLKAWIISNYPDQKPAFLFDEIERTTHAAINADSFLALQVERDALKARIEKSIEVYRNLKQECDTIASERDSLRKMVDDFTAKLQSAGAPGERAETTYQNIIAALLDCIAGNLPNVEKHPSFESEAKLIEAIDEHYRGYGGLSQSNLSRKFPEAKRNLKNQ